MTTKVMILGDSITVGQTASVPVTADQMGGRLRLWKRSTNAGLALDLVGSQSNGTAELPDRDHEGHAGWRLDELNAIASARISTYSPSVVVLEGGTNDIAQGASAQAVADRLDQVLQTIQAADASIRVLYTIPPHLPPTDLEAVRLAYAKLVAAVLASRRAADQLVWLVDASWIEVSTGDNHPTLLGYDQLGELWWGGLMTLLSSPKVAVRSNVRIAQATLGDGIVRVTASSNGTISSLVVGGVRNATVSSVTYSGGSASFTATRVAPGGWMASFTAVDAFGPWPAFVGAGS